MGIIFNPTTVGNSHSVNEIWYLSFSMMYQENSCNHFILESITVTVFVSFYQINSLDRLTNPRP